MTSLQSHRLPRKHLVEDVNSSLFPISRTQPNNSTIHQV